MGEHKEFIVIEKGGKLLVLWSGCDGRVVATCRKAHEAVEIASLLNSGGTAERWYERASAELDRKDGRDA